MIPDDCAILIDSRPQPGIEPADVETVLRQALERAQALDPEARYELELTDRKAPHLIARDHPLVETMAEAYRAVVGSDPLYGGGSWLADTASTGHLVPTVIFGPGREPVYMPNEWLAVEDIDLATRVYAATAARVLAPDG